MQITETLNEGLKRELKVVVPAADLEERLAKRLDDAKDRVQLKGFRPGKVPLGHLRKMYGKSFMAEVVNEILNDSRAILAERNEKSATQPQVSMTEDEKEAEKILAGQSDFAFTMSYEVLPEFALGDISKIKITREVVDIPDAEVDEQVERVASSARSYTAKDGKAADGDRVTMDYLGKIDGEPFEGGADQGANLVLGSGQFIPGFEEQLVGVKAGDEKVITVTFPADYSAAHLAGKDATFDIKVSEVAAPDELAIDDEMAKKLGLESLERLREIVRGQLESQYGSVTRQKIKRQILDALDESHKFDTPSTLVDAEFNNIWTQITRELEQAGQTFADEDTTEDEAREEYRRLAERRVRLGLVLSKIGEDAKVEVSDDELQRALFEQVRQYPGQEQQIYEFYRSNPDAVAALRAPIFEDKVVDHLLTQVAVTDKTVSKEALLADDAEEEAKPAAKKKAPAKKAAAKAADDTDEAPKKAPAKKKAAPKKKAE
ncbi:MAG: trigger factor [Brucellaceae bacterium]|nr:trigger factor [Brucellaceae bacterium]